MNLFLYIYIYRQIDRQIVRNPMKPLTKLM